MYLVICNNQKSEKKIPLYLYLLVQISSLGYYAQQRWVFMLHITPNERWGSHCAAWVRKGLPQRVY